MNMTIEELLKTGAGLLAENNLPEPQADAQALLASVTGKKRINLFIEREQPVGEDKKALYLDMISKRLRRVPLNYLTGEKEFMGMSFHVMPGVFIPRPETEILVEEALKLVNENPGIYSRILDIGTGSGNIAVSMSKLSSAAVYAVDINPLSIKLAKMNSSLLGAQNMEFFEGDMFAPLHAHGLEKTFGMIVTNPPYIPADEISGLQPEVRNEPRTALDGGASGLDFFRRIAAHGRPFLSDNGIVAMEIGDDQLKAVCDLFMSEGYTILKKIKDYSGLDRVVIVKI